MDGSWIARGLVVAGGRARGLHPFRFLTEQRLHLAVVLTLLLAAAAPLRAGDIDLNPNISPEDFQTFSHIIAQGIYASPIEPARATGLLNFDIGIAATAVKVDENADYWRHSVSGSFASHGYVGVPRLVVSKGFGSGTISGSYAKLNDSGLKTYGGAIDIPLMRGSTLFPELAARGTYARLTGSDVYSQKTYGIELFLSKGFGPVTPYIAAGRQRSDATGTIAASSPLPSVSLHDRSDFYRYTAGVRLSLLVPKLVVEATQAEVRSYSAKISFGW